MMCLYPVYLKSQNLYVPCGKCKACRINNVMQLSLRAYHEYLTSKCASFVTLTYSDSNVPKNYNLCYDDFLRFLKYFKKLSKIKGLKYLVAGEYGGQFGRPHFHCVLYNVDKSCVEFIRKAWKNQGFIDVKPAIKESFGYIAKYNLKTKSQKEKEFLLLGKIPPFVRISKGLGREWCEQHREILERDLCIKQNGKVIPLPEYYLRILNYSRDTKGDRVSPLRNHLNIRRQLKFESYLAEIGNESPQAYLLRSSKNKASKLLGKVYD